MAESKVFVGRDDSMSDDEYVPSPPSICRQGGAGHMTPEMERAMNPYRNGYVVDGVPVPEPEEHVYAVYKHLVIEEDSFTRGYITDVPAYVQEHGVINFMRDTDYKYSLGCLLLYPAIARAQRQYVQAAIFKCQ
jgi:hypothetical protein